MSSVLYEYTSPDQQPNTRVLLTQRARNRITVWGLQARDPKAFLARLQLAADVTLHSVDAPLDAPEYVEHREGDMRMLVAVGRVAGCVQTVLLTESDLPMARIWFRGRSLVRREWDGEVAA